MLQFMFIVYLEVKLLLQVYCYLQVYLELLDTTLHMAVVFVDRFLSLQRITPSSLQLLGITCILIAAKYYERFPPQVTIARYQIHHDS